MVASRRIEGNQDYYVRLIVSGNGWGIHFLIFGLNLQKYPSKFTRPVIEHSPAASYDFKYKIMDRYELSESGNNFGPHKINTRYANGLFLLFCYFIFV